MKEISIHYDKKVGERAWRVRHVHNGIALAELRKKKFLSFPTWRAEFTSFYVNMNSK